VCAHGVAGAADDVDGVLVVPVVQDRRQHVHVAIPRELSAKKSPDDLRPAHGAAFQAIEPDGSRVTEMAAAAQMTAQGLGQLVDQLQRLGYVDRVPDPRDGRAKLVVLTDRGWEAVAVGRRALADMEAAWDAALGRRRSDAFRAALAVIAELLDEPPADAAADQRS
jgi:DNA-binding MarR family transcriptional regulator